MTPYGLGCLYMILAKRCQFLFVFYFMSSYCLPIEMFQLPRVAIPSKIQMDHEKTAFSQRQMKRFVVKCGTTAAVLVLMYAAFKASEYFDDIDKRLETVDKRVFEVEKEVSFDRKPRNLEKKDTVVSTEISTRPVTIFAPIVWTAQGIKSCVVGTQNFVTDLGKCVIKSCPTFITGMILSSFWQHICNRIIEASKQETISWYIASHTQVWGLFHDITLACIPYDLYSELLSLQQVQDKAGICKQSYVDEFSEIVRQNKQDSMPEGYFDYSCGELKKDYAKKSLELAQLQDYAAPNIAKRKRVIHNGLQDGSLFQSDVTARQNLVDLITMLTTQVQQVVSFATMCIDNHRSCLSQECVARGEKRINQIIESMNQYLDQMECMLNMSHEQLEGLSIAHKGMFTCTYEYERLFREQINVLHRYCSLIG